MLLTYACRIVSFTKPSTVFDQEVVLSTLPARGTQSDAEWSEILSTANEEAMGFPSQVTCYGKPSFYGLSFGDSMAEFCSYETDVQCLHTLEVPVSYAITEVVLSHSDIKS
jgi:hypothetical protein